MRTPLDITEQDRARARSLPSPATTSQADIDLWNVDDEAEFIRVVRLTE